MSNVHVHVHVHVNVHVHVHVHTAVYMYIYMYMYMYVYGSYCMVIEKTEKCIRTMESKGSMYMWDEFSDHRKACGNAI